MHVWGDVCPSTRQSFKVHVSKIRSSLERLSGVAGKELVAYDTAKQVYSVQHLRVVSDSKLLRQGSKGLEQTDKLALISRSSRQYLPQLTTSWVHETREALREALLELVLELEKDVDTQGAQTLVTALRHILALEPEHSEARQALGRLTMEANK